MSTSSRNFRTDPTMTWPEPFVLGENEYSILRRVARNFLKRERSGHTLQPTALVHEAFLRVFCTRDSRPPEPGYVVYAVTLAMRRILIDYARRRTALKRNAGEGVRTDAAATGYRYAEEILTLEAALSELKLLSPRCVQVVELRYFCGMTLEETAEVLAVSPETVKLDWRSAKTWLRGRMRGEGEQAAA